MIFLQMIFNDHGVGIQIKNIFQSGDQFDDIGNFIEFNSNIDF